MSILFYLDTKVHIITLLRHSELRIPQKPETSMGKERVTHTVQGKRRKQRQAWIKEREANAVAQQSTPNTHACRFVTL
jgi:hypothetical protein